MPYTLRNVEPSERWECGTRQVHPFPTTMRRTRRSVFLLVLLAVLCVLLCPSHSSFAQHLDARATASSSALGNLVLSPLRALGMSGERQAYRNLVFLSVASSGRDSFLGVLGCWFPLGRWDPVASLADSVLSLSLLGDDEAFVDVWLSVATMVLFYALWQVSQTWTNTMNRHAVISAWNLRSGRIWCVIGAAFSHEELWHLLRNVIMLLSVAPDLHTELGRKRFLLLYALGAHGAAAATLLWNEKLRGVSISSLGASGAIYALLGFETMLHPQKQHLFAGFPLTAAQMLAVQLGLDLVLRASRGIDVAAHLGGALTGALYLNYLLQSS